MGETLDTAPHSGVARPDVPRRVQFYEPAVNKMSPEENCVRARLRDLAFAVREIVQGALGRFGRRPYPEIVQLLERRHVEALVRVHQLADCVPARQVEQQALRRRFTASSGPVSAA